jgi:hypothetical protein
MSRKPLFAAFAAFAFLDHGSAQDTVIDLC